MIIVTAQGRKGGRKERGERGERERRKEGRKERIGVNEAAMPRRDRHVALAQVGWSNIWNLGPQPYSTPILQRRWLLYVRRRVTCPRCESNAGGPTYLLHSLDTRVSVATASMMCTNTCPPPQSTIHKLTLQLALRTATSSCSVVAAA